MLGLLLQTCSDEQISRRVGADGTSESDSDGAAKVPTVAGTVQKRKRGGQATGRQHEEGGSQPATAYRPDGSTKGNRNRGKKADKYAKT